MPYLRIFRLCLVILFLEFILIRWLSTEISILAYLQNSVLVACFLGLGMGLIAPKSGDDPSRCLLPLLFLTAITSIPGVREGIRESAISLSYFHDFVVWNEASKVAPIPLISALLILFSILGSCWAIMVPLGAELGRLLETTPQRLLAYSADIFGSLVGVLLFTLLAYLSLNPVWWFFILSALLFLFGGTFHSRKNILSIVLILGFSLLGKFTEDADLTVWTPYQKIEFLNLSKKGEWVVIVNNSGFQQIQNNLDLYKLSRDDQIPNQYNIPSRIASPARRALVVGAGTGNDVAGLVAHSNADIVGVDIDPVLLKLGSKLHPEKPYLNRRVELKENDARAVFLNQPAKSFDLIVFGLLDSHTTPQLSNARIDNFVYTREAIRAAKRLLTDDGVMCIIFQVQREYVSNRLRNLLSESFAQEPLIFHIPNSDRGWGGTAFIVGDKSRIDANIAGDPLLANFIKANPVSLSTRFVDIPPTTDNWPYLYIERPSIPSLFLVLGSILIILWIGSSRRRYGHIVSPHLRQKDDMTFMLLGISFSLVQVFSINKASILFGSTWFVNSSVIAGILGMILISNVIASRWKPSFLWTGLAVVLVTLMLGLIPLTPLLEYPMGKRALIAGALSGLPLLLSGILFASAFESSKEPGRALGSNLFGAMLGGILQLITFQLGIASTIYLAAFFYLGATILGSWQPIVSSNR